MRKYLLYLLILCFSQLAFSTPNCFGDYNEAFKKIERKYIKQQLQTKGFYYEVIATSMFPFFCLPKDTITKSIQNKYDVLFLCSYSNNIYRYYDKFKREHIIITVLNYTKLYSKSIPEIKTYKAFFLVSNLATNKWEEERSPIQLNFYLNKDRQTYFCK